MGAPEAGRPAGPLRGPLPRSRAEPARAKVNLALHVTGRRADGFHTLDTLVAFPPIADTVTVTAAGDGEGSTLTVDGPFAAAVPTGPDNLVLRAAARLAEAAGDGDDAGPDASAGAAGGGSPSTAGRLNAAHIRLTKTLPVAAGLGGGSADAAATLRALDGLWGLGLGPDRLADLGRPLGADVAMCVHARSLRATGIGDVVERFVALPAAGIVLVNPGVAVPTPAVFAALARRDNPPLPPLPDRFTDAADLAAFLHLGRNDLEAAARTVAPGIGDVLAALSVDPDVLLARLSGSGATVFALTADAASADRVAARIVGLGRPWWVAAAALDAPTV
jgi:4-diphosphocytidyl-2-C-methyl-D-erythritol kinase